MDTTLVQALQLTLLGMGMTFASIGALALGILVMTQVTKERHNTGTPDGMQVGTSTKGWVNTSDNGETGITEMSGSSEAVESPDKMSDSAAAAAAATVAVALATNGAAQAAAAAVAVCLAGSQPSGPQVQAPAVDAWNSFVRSVHVSRRAHHDTRRVRS